MASRIRDIQEPLNLARSRQALSSTSCDLRHWKSRRPDHISRRPRSLGRPILGPASEHARRAFSWPRSALIRPLGSGKISRGGVAGSGPVRMYGCAPFFIATVVSGVAPAGVSGTRAGATGTQPGGLLWSMLFPGTYLDLHTFRIRRVTQVTRHAAVIRRTAAIRP